jgi:hypothetical protein
MLFVSSHNVEVQGQLPISFIYLQCTLKRKLCEPQSMVTEWKFTSPACWYSSPYPINMLAELSQVIILFLTQFAVFYCDLLVTIFYIVSENSSSLILFMPLQWNVSYQHPWWKNSVCYYRVHNYEDISLQNNYLSHLIFCLIYIVKEEGMNIRLLEYT